MQKHQNFEQEIKANTSRIEELTSAGEKLIDDKHYAAGQWTRRRRSDAQGRAPGSGWLLAPVPVCC